MMPMFPQITKAEVHRTVVRDFNSASFDVRSWPILLQTGLRRVGIKPIQIFPGSPWENGYNERFNGTLRREVLNAEWFTSIDQAGVVITEWLRQYNHTRPHQALNMRPLVPETLHRSGP